MSKGMVKTASGAMILKNSSPAAIEEYLVSLMNDALGSWRDVVKVKPYLRIDEEDADLSNNVKNGFGAIELTAYGVKLYIPFIISDKTLLPFDTIRMGDQEISYDYSKLRRVINAIEHKAKEEDEGSEGSHTMELADFDDVQYNNGFLGSIMQIRDNHRNKDGRNDDEYRGPGGFGTVDETRMMRMASDIDVFEGFHEVMEKIADVQTFTPSQLEAYEKHLLKEAEKEELESFEKTAAEQTETLDAAKIKRDMMKLEDEKLFNVHRAASGNNIAFPLYEDNRVEFRVGRVYRNFESWFKNTSNYSSNRLGALVLDTKGGYHILKSNEAFMASTRQPDSVELPTTHAKSLEVGPMYILEKDSGTVFNPFIIENTWMRDVLNDGIVLSVRESMSDPSFRARTANSLLSDVYECKEVSPGRYSNSVMAGFGNERFSIVVTKDPTVTEPMAMSYEEVQRYIVENAQDMEDAKLAKNMLFYTKDCVVIHEDFPFFKAQKNIKGFYTRPDGLFNEGPLAKTASYEGQNKATLIVKKDRNPKTYAVKWSFTKADKGSDGVESTKLEKRYQDGLSKQQAQSLLGSLGFDYRTQAKFFEITDRNGRSATFNIRSSERASQASPTDKANSKVKKKMSGIANSMLNSSNFTPIMADTVAGGISSALGTLAPGTINAAHNVGDFLGMKQAESTAYEIEKVATQLNGSEWHELSALLNMKYRLDKLAQSVMDGNYLYKGTEPFKKVAAFKPVIEKKASDLIDFNRKQLLNTTSYLVKPSLVKEALSQLDGLYAYASSFQDEKKKTTIEKQAGLFNGKAKQELKLLDGTIDSLKQNAEAATRNFSDKHAQLRALMYGDINKPALEQASVEVQQAKDQMNQSISSLQEAMRQRDGVHEGIAKKNMGLAAGVGVPGLAGLSYINEEAKDDFGKEASTTPTRRELQETIDEKRDKERSLGMKAGLIGGAALGYMGGRKLPLDQPFLTGLGGSFIGMHLGSVGGKHLAQNTFNQRHSDLIDQRNKASN
ncbi:hypothetical protein [Priestia megaterium]|uniref:hypothetical protein n=1 Tax=Priestia megaterium TaxID=1404 RepID=UPI000BFD1083|nr:hypothetical protein [Priestia megaterium]PGQ88208.1 hypothetical protein COA18_04590 [Priestia megaterium]